LDTQLEKTVVEFGTGPQGRSRLDGDFIELAIRLGLLGSLVYWCFVVVQPFIPIVIWSFVLAVALYPTFDWMSARLGGRRRLAAALMTGLSLLVIIGPVTWLGLGLVDGLRTLAERLGSGSLTIPPPSETVRTWPLVSEPVYQFWDLASTNLTSALAKIAPQLRPLGSSVLGVAGSASTGALKFLASVVVAGFLFPPGPSLVRAVKTLSLRISARGGEFVELAGATIRTVSRGVIGVSVLQALLAGIGLLVAEVPGASMLAFLVLSFGIIQIGAWIVIIPIIIWSWATMATVAAVLFTAYMVPVVMLDNILKPIVMGRGLTTPGVIILAGVIGGTLAHGIVGLFIGPVVLAVAWELLVAWMGDDASRSVESDIDSMLA
jgi:predicted PurR-regulated permease PerM